MEDAAGVTSKIPTHKRYCISETSSPEAGGWFSARAGVSLSTLFDDGRGYRVALAAYAPGAIVPLHLHTADEHAFVLTGRVYDTAGEHGQGTYLHNPAGTRQALSSPGGCRLILHWLGEAQFLEEADLSLSSADSLPVIPSLRLATLPANDQAWEVLRPGVDILPLFEGPPGNYKAALLRYHPGAAVPVHVHLGDEHIYVLSGSQEDEHGNYGAGTYVFNPAGTRHWVASEEGCTVLIHWRAPVRFVSDLF